MFLGFEMLLQNEIRNWLVT